MDHPSRSRADAAYERALAAYQERAYDVARRWTNEALGHDPQHAGARALLARLDGAGQAAAPFQPASSGSQVVSTDPTVLISRGSVSPPKTEPIDPTAAIARADGRQRHKDTEPRNILPSRSAARPGAEPTIIAQPRSRTVSPSRQRGFSLGAALQALGERLQSGGKRSRQSSAGRGGPLLALGMVAVGALLVLAIYVLIGVIWPPGQLLTIVKPTGGTIVGPGIECGTLGSRCSTSVPTGEVIALEARPDKDYVWSGYIRDCAPAGRLAMTEPRTCGATFDPVSAAPAPVTFRLSITKPEGGTIIAAGGILCGVNGSTCTADIPSGAPVTLKAEAADGFAWEQFTGDCPSTGEMVMTSAKTCGAAFVPSAKPINIGPPVKPTRPTRPAGPPPPPPPTPGPDPQPAPPKPTDSQGTTSTSKPPEPTAPTKPAAPPISPEDHAKREIGQLVKNYCMALGTLNPAAIRKLFHRDIERELRDKYREYKSLKCSLASEPDYERLDAGPAGAAQVKFGIKQAIEMRSGGAPRGLELNVTMVVSRTDFQSPWLIDRVTVEEKPK